MTLLQSALPGLTQWQFYAMAATLFVVGCVYCYIQMRLAFRDTLDGYTYAHDSKRFDNMRGNVSLGFLIAMATVSFFFLPALFYSFTNDFSTAVANVIVDTGAAAIQGKEIDMSGYDIDMSGLVWGWPQNEDLKFTIYGLPLCAFLLGMCLYIGMAQPSPVGNGKKALKVLLQLTLLATLLAFNNLHYFNTTELLCIAVPAAASAALWLASRASDTDLASPPKWFTTKYGEATPPPLPR